MSLRHKFSPVTMLVMLAALLTVLPSSLFSAPRKKQRIPAKAETTLPAIVPKAKALREGGPNVLVIVAEGLNDWTGWQGGHPQALTPNMDKLARRGMRFSNAHAAISASNPSRVALLTGMWPWKSAVTSASQDWRKSGPTYDKVTFPEHFRAAGFLTILAGTAYDVGRGPGGAYDWDASWDVKLPPSPADDRAKDYGNGRLAKAAGELMKQKRDEPFFLVVGWRAPASLMAKPSEFPLDSIQWPASARDRAEAPSANVRQEIRAQLLTLAHYDALLGQLLDSLEQSAAAQDTIVILTGDRGGVFYPDQAGGALGEEATRVPLTVFVPGVTQPDTSTARPVSLVDIYPTLCELTKVKLPSHLDGESLVSLLTAPDAARERPVIATAEGGAKAGLAVRDVQWRYIRDGKGTETLFDYSLAARGGSVAADSAETQGIKKRLAASFPEMWAKPNRAFAQVKMESVPDGGQVYWLEARDEFDLSGSPDLTGKGLDIEVTFDYAPEKSSNAVLVSQGDEKLGYALHLVEGKPALTINYEGLRTTLKAAEALPAGKRTVRALLGLDGTLGVGSFGKGNDAHGFAPMEGGFPRRFDRGLSIGEAAAALPPAEFPKSAAFGEDNLQVLFHILPGVTEELPAPSAIPVEENATVPNP